MTTIEEQAEAPPRRLRERLDAAIRACRRNSTVEAEPILCHLLAELEGVEAPKPATPSGPRVCVAALVTDPAGRILLGKRNKDPNRGQWVLPGGGIEAGETWAEAAAREIREEANLEIEVPPGQHPYVVENVGDKGSAPGFRGAVILFVRGAGSGEPKGADDLLEPTWFAPDALPEGLSPITADALRVLLAVSEAPLDLEALERDTIAPADLDGIENRSAKAHTVAAGQATRRLVAAARHLPVLLARVRWLETLWELLGDDAERAIRFREQKGGQQAGTPALVNCSPSTLIRLRDDAERALKGSRR